MFEYTGFVTGVYDGDTITVDIDLGFGFWKLGEKLRLFGIDAPELRGETIEAGRASRDFLRSLVLDRKVIINTTKDRKGKYGRYLATIRLIDPPELLAQSVNATLVEHGFAVYRSY